MAAYAGIGASWTRGPGMLGSIALPVLWLESPVPSTVAAYDDYHY